MGFIVAFTYKKLIIFYVRKLSNLIKNQLKVEAEILDNNKRLLRVLNNKKLL